MEVQSMSWSMIAVLTVILLFLAIFIITARNAKDKVAPKVANQSTPQFKENLAREKRAKINLAVIVGLLVLGFVIGLFFYSKSNGGINGSDDDSPLPFIIWMAVFVPLLANKKKKQNIAQLSKIKQQRAAFRAIFFAILLILGIITIIFIMGS